MWGKRYFSSKYWASRFFPPVSTGAADVNLRGASHGTSTAQGRLSADLSLHGLSQGTSSAHGQMSGGTVFLHGSSHGTSTARLSHGFGAVTADIAPVRPTATIEPISPLSILILSGSPSASMLPYVAPDADISAAYAASADIARLSVTATIVRMDNVLVEPPSIIQVDEIVAVTMEITRICPTATISSSTVSATISRVEEPLALVLS